MALDFPKSSTHKPSTQKVNELVSRIGKPLAWIARESGISYSRMRMLVAGERELPGKDGETKKVPVLMKYPEQYVLEGLAALTEAADRLR